MTYTIKISTANTAKLRPICEATRYHPAKLANMLIGYALEKVRLAPTTDTIYDIRFWSGDNGASVQNTRQYLPQLLDLYSGLKS